MKDPASDPRPRTLLPPWEKDDLSIFANEKPGWKIAAVSIVMLPYVLRGVATIVLALGFTRWW
jgi:hypothetical protein